MSPALCVQTMKRWRQSLAHTTSPTHFSFPSMNAKISQCAKKKKKKNPNKYAHNKLRQRAGDYRDRIAQTERTRQCALVECVKLTDAHLDHTPAGSWAKHTHVNTDTHLGSGSESVVDVPVPPTDLHQLCTLAPLRCASVQLY